MSFGMVFSQRLTQSLQLSQEQRIKLDQANFSLRLELIQILRNERYEPRATCPNCSRGMTPVEIIKGFKQEPNDFTTGCSACGHRFEPTLICFGEASQIQIPFYCGIQALEKLREQENLSPEQISRELPGVYRSAIIHYGGLKQAFARLGIRYEYEEISNWKVKVAPFLGRMPDTLIANCVDAPAYVIRHMRRKQGISRYTLRKSLEEASED